MKNISRRDFLKGSLAAAISAGMVSGLGNLTALADDAAAPEEGGLFVPETVDEVFDCDVVIVGTGISGLSAAVQAGESGLKTIVLEKGAALGGMGVGVEGIFGCNTDDQQAMGIELDAGEIIRHELKTAQYFPNGVLWTDLVHASAENYSWLKENGVLFNGEINDYGGLYECFHWFEGGNAGTGYMPPMSEKAKSYGVEFFTETAARSLIFDGTTVSGVYAERGNGGFIQVNAKAVVLATGGFGYNDELLKRWGWNVEHITKMGSPNNNGDGYEMGISVGAQDCLNDACALAPGSIDGLSSLGPAGMQLTVGGPWLWVNRDGERFTAEDISDENVMQQYLPVVVQRNCYVVTNAAILQGVLGEDGMMDAFNSVVEQCPSDNIYMADTLEELAAKFGIDPATLMATVERYNSMCDNGQDADFAKKPSLLLPIREAPYYMYRLDPAILVMLGGLGTSRDLEVLKEDGTPIPGLYAIGLDGVRLYRHTYCANVPGTCCANGVNSGRRAIKHIAANL